MSFEDDCREPEPREAPKSIAYYRCNACREVTPEPHDMTETELRAALDDCRIVGMRLHAQCPRINGVEKVFRTSRTIFAILGDSPVPPAAPTGRMTGMDRTE
jgi:hypothetical protein